MAARDRHAVRGHRAGGLSVPHGQRLLQHRLRLMREGRAGVIGLQLTTAPKQVRETRVMRRLIKPSIGRPAVPHEDAREVGPENRRGLVEAPTRLNGVDGGARRRIHPQPLQLSPNPPAGFVGHDHRTLPDRLDQRRIGRRGLPRGAMERLDQHPPGVIDSPKGC